MAKFPARGKSFHFRGNFSSRMVTFSPRNTNIYKICKLHKPTFFVVFYISPPNFAILLLLKFIFPARVKHFVRPFRLLCQLSLAQILRPHNTTVAHKPSTTLRDLLTNSRTGVVYKIPCAECPTSYVGEIGRTVECRIKVHKGSIANQDRRNNIAVRHVSTKH